MDTSTWYNSCLITWANQVHNQGGPLNQVLNYSTDPTYDNENMGGTPYSDAVNARAFLVKNIGEGGAGWTITGDRQV